MQEIECVISGKVQGVNFRHFVQTKAKGLWVSGYVENMPQQGLKVVAQGSEEKLNALIDHLHKGPFAAKVSNVTVAWREPAEKYNDFSIHY